MLSLSQTRELLARLGHQPNKTYGQNYLIDANIVRKSLTMSGLRPGEAVVEVGPGLGTLTRALLQAGAEVWAVEADKAMFRYLQDGVVPHSDGRLHLLQGDAVQSPRAGLPEERAHYRVIANLPYAISTPWLEQLLAGALPESITVMVQRETAERLMAEAGTKRYGAVSIFLQSLYRQAALHPVARTCFYPAPEVDSVLLHLQQHPQGYVFTAAQRAVIRKIFTQRRKQIGGIIRRLPEAAELSSWLTGQSGYGVDAQSRPEQIPLQAWQSILR